MLTGKKTAIFAFILVMLGAAQSFEWITLVTDPVASGRIVAGIGLAVMILRALTNTALFKSE